MENNRVLLISSEQNVIIIKPNLKDEKAYPEALILRGDYKIINNDIEELRMYIHQLIELSSLEESIILQPVLNKIYDLDIRR